jgi:hypothetical protein
MKKQEEINKNIFNTLEAIKQEINYTLYNGLLFSATIRTLMDMFLKTEDDIKNFNSRLEINFKLIEKEFLDGKEEQEPKD